MEHTIARFEKAFRLGKQPRIEDYLKSAGNAQQRRRMLIELVHVELELRLKAGQRVQIEEYVGRYPALLEEASALLSLIHAEYWLRRQRREDVKSDEYYQRFPQLIGELESELELTTDISAGSLPSESNASDETDLFVARLSDAPEDSDVVACEAPFSSLPLNVVRLLKARMTERRFADGEHLMRQGDPGSALMIVSTGHVEIHVEDEQGITHLIDTTGAGNILGEMSLLTEEPCTASAIAVGPVRVLSLPAADFHALLKQHPILSHALTNIVANRLGRFARDVLSGKTFFDCSIGRRLGRGGMSVVYEATHLPTAHRVALKMMSHRLANDDEALESFQREADLIERFDHPHIVRTHGRFGAFRTYFIILEFVEGESLDKTIRSRGPLPEAEVRTILAQVASALAHAHALQVIHRDIKPSNIMLGSDQHAKLMDFGLAVPLDDPVLESAGRVRGTPQYMAPEQIAGEPLSPAADYFGLGCVAYEMLTGTRLFRDPSLAELIERHLTWKPVSFRVLCPNAGDVLGALLDTCLHPSPRERRLDLEQLARCAPGPAGFPSPRT